MSPLPGCHYRRMARRMTRHALFAALASLPFVGRFVRRPACDGFTDDTAALQALLL